MSKNTMPEAYDEAPGGVETPTQEDILMNEDALLRGLIEASTEKDSESTYKRVQIRRNGVLKFEFRIRPVSRRKAWPVTTTLQSSHPASGASRSGKSRPTRPCSALG